MSQVTFSREIVTAALCLSVLAIVAGPSFGSTASGRASFEVPFTMQCSGQQESSWSCYVDVRLDGIPKGESVMAAYVDLHVDFFQMVLECWCWDPDVDGGTFFTSGGVRADLADGGIIEGKAIDHFSGYVCVNNTCGHS